MEPLHAAATPVPLEPPLRSAGECMILAFGGRLMRPDQAHREANLIYELPE